MRKELSVLFSLLCVFLIAGQCTAEGIPAVTAVSLLSSAKFPNSSFGMSVTSVTEGNIAYVITTGAEFVIKKGIDEIQCKQRIPGSRTLATIKLPTGSLGSVALTYQSSGAAIFSGGNTTVRINGDSLLMISPGVGGNIVASLTFTPDYHSAFKGSYNFFDPTGGISFFDHGKCSNSTLQAKVDPVTVTWPWTARNVFWACVSPPKAYDWVYPSNYKAVVHTTEVARYMYPHNIELLLWERHLGWIALLNYKGMWNNWQSDLTPRDPAGLQRIIFRAHEYSPLCHIIPYVSPRHYLKGTPIEDMASRDPNFSPTWDSGSNETQFIQAITSVKQNYGIDGLYVDGLYRGPEALATNYHLTRTMRDLFGSGTIELHASYDVYSNRQIGTYCPVIHSYYSLVQKGIGYQNTTDPVYLRYYASTYGISNSTSIAYFMDSAPSAAQLDKFNRMNVNFHFPWTAIYNNSDQIYRNAYWPNISTLNTWIMPDLARRTGAFDAYRSTLP